jgi:hypothetical protein
VKHLTNAQSAAHQKKISSNQHKTTNLFLFQTDFTTIQKHYISPSLGFMVVNFLGCWKWFNGVLKEAEVNVTEANKSEIDQVIHKYIGEQSSYGKCSTDWRKARKEINESPEMRSELIQKLKALT